MKTETYLKANGINDIEVIGTGGGCDVLEKCLPGKWLAWCSDGDGNAPLSTRETGCVVYLYPDEEDCGDFVLAMTGTAAQCIDYMVTLEPRPPVKQFIVVWDGAYAIAGEPSIQKTVELEHFTADMGYPAENVRHVNALHVGEGVNLSYGGLDGRVCAVRIA